MPKKLTTDRTDTALIDVEDVIRGSMGLDIETDSCELNPPSLVTQKDWDRVAKALKNAGYKVEVVEWQDIHDGPGQLAQEARPAVGDKPAVPAKKAIPPKVIGQLPKHVRIYW